MKRLALLLFVAFWGIVGHAQAWMIHGDLEPTSRYDDFVFVTPEKGWAVNSSGRVYRTDDGGLTWTISYQDYYDEYLRSVDFIDENVGFVGSLDNLLLRTTDGGETWVEMQDSVPGPIPGICGLSHFGQNVYGVGAFYYPAYFIKSEDAGINWTYLDMSVHVDGLVDCHFVSDQIGFVSGIKDSEGSVILKTEDGGVTWTEKFNSMNGSEYLWKLYFVNDMVIYGAIESFFAPGTQIVKSIDGGETWEIKDVLTDFNMDIQGIGFLDELKGWVGPRNEPIYETIDGGETWYPLIGFENINRFFRLDNGPLFAAGSTLFVYDEAMGLTGNQADIPDHGFSISPNPVSEDFQISLSLTARTFVKLGLFDLEGRLLADIHDKYMPPGEQNFQVNVDGLKLSSGSYILFLRTNEGFQALKVQVVN